MNFELSERTIINTFHNVFICSLFFSPASAWTSYGNQPSYGCLHRTNSLILGTILGKVSVIILWRLVFPDYHKNIPPLQKLPYININNKYCKNKVSSSSSKYVQQKTFYLSGVGTEKPDFKGLLKKLITAPAVLLIVFITITLSLVLQGPRQDVKSGGEGARIPKNFHPRWLGNEENFSILIVDKCSKKPIKYISLSIL